MPNADLNAVIRSLVANEVENTLAPYRELLERMAGFLGAPAPRRGPGRPRGPSAAAGAAPRKPRAARRGRAAKGGDASRFREGQLVRYKQGRGEFEAKVLEVDVNRNVLVIQRTSDDKKVERPADKVYEVA